MMRLPNHALQQLEASGGVFSVIEPVPASLCR